jgi:aerobic C4-dicarboxylate transport protein
MIIASKGAAGVTGAGLATPAGGLQSHRPDLVGRVGLTVGIERFMCEARALTNFAGNAIATVLIDTWAREVDHAQMRRVLAGADPFDETTPDDHAYEPDGERAGDGAEDSAEESGGERSVEAAGQPDAESNGRTAVHASSR